MSHLLGVTQKPWIRTIHMNDGTEFVAEPGDITSLPKSHDAWAVGDEPAIIVDFFGASNHAKAG
jgi:hypothetical protein